MQSAASFLLAETQILNGQILLGMTCQTAWQLTHEAADSLLLLEDLKHPIRQFFSKFEASRSEAATLELEGRWRKERDREERGRGGEELRPVRSLEVKELLSETPPAQVNKDESETMTEVPSSALKPSCPNTTPPLRYFSPLPSLASLPSFPSLSLPSSLPPSLFPPLLLLPPPCPPRQRVLQALDRVCRLQVDRGSDGSMSSHHLLSLTSTTMKEELQDGDLAQLRAQLTSASPPSSQQATRTHVFGKLLQQIPSKRPARSSEEIISIPDDLSQAPWVVQEICSALDERVVGVE
eukprot:187650-Hanusia_phi.AAC.1